MDTVRGAHQASRRTDHRPRLSDRPTAEGRGYRYVERLTAQAHYLSSSRTPRARRCSRAVPMFSPTARRTWNTYSRAVKARTPVNGCAEPHFAEGGVNNMVHGGTIWQLEPDQALIIELDPSGAPYWSIQNYVPPWLLPLDFIHRVTSFNDAQAHIDEDGKVRLVLFASGSRRPELARHLGVARGAVFGPLDRRRDPTHDQRPRGCRHRCRRPTPVHTGVLDRRASRPDHRSPPRRRTPVPALRTTMSTEVLSYFERLSNWGRWGDDDQLGTLNLITPHSRRAAARAVRHGVSVSCAWDIDAGPTGAQRATFAVPYMAQAGGSDDVTMGGYHTDQRWGVAAETLTFAFHGGAYTHLDSPAHVLGRPDVQRAARRTGAGRGRRDVGSGHRRRGRAGHPRRAARHRRNSRRRLAGTRRPGPAARPRRRRGTPGRQGRAG